MTRVPANADDLQTVLGIFMGLSAILFFLFVRARWGLYKTRKEVEAAQSEERRARVDQAVADARAAEATTARDVAIGERKRALTESTTARKERDKALSEVQAAEQAKSAAFEEKKVAYKELKTARVDIQTLRAELNMLVNLDERIRHDLPKRLHGLSQYILGNMPAGPGRADALADIYTVIERVRMHLASDIRAHVTYERKEGKGLEGDGESLVRLIRWIGKMYDFENRLEIVGSETIGIMHKRVFWDIMLTNVLSNAVFHAGRVGRVEVRVIRQEDGSGRVDISNEGPPIPKSEIGRVFNLGYTTKEGGRGLGLFVAQEIAMGLGGKILPPSNESNWMGRNKRVTFSIVDLPIVDVALA